MVGLTTRWSGPLIQRQTQSCLKSGLANGDLSERAPAAQLATVRGLKLKNVSKAVGVSQHGPIQLPIDNGIEYE